jgi:sarcosine oxidase gamma subunit
MQFALSMALAQFSAPLRPHTYHPGRPVQDAVPVHVDVGIDALGLETTFAPAPGAAVSGVVLGPDGSPLRTQVTLSMSRRSGAPAIPPYRTSSAADGTVAFPFVAAGEYVVQAEAERPGAALAAVVSASMSAFGGSVTGVNVTGGGATRDVVSGVAGVWTAENIPPFASAFVPVASGARARATEDGAIDAVGLIGPLRVIASATPDDWWLGSAYIDGVNAVHEPVMFGTLSQSRRDVEVVFSSAPSGLRGRVVIRLGSPAPAATVLAFPSDWTRWHAGTRYVRQAPATSGQYELAALPPGQYYVAAADAVTAAVTEWQEPDALNGLIPFARLVGRA